MLALAIFLTAVVNPWIGVWKLTFEDDSKPPQYLVVRTLEQIEFYGIEWYPYQINIAELPGDAVKLQGVLDEGRPQPFTLTGSQTDGVFTGSLQFQFPQGMLDYEVSGMRELEIPCPSPVDLVRDMRSENTIDIVEYVLKRAPRDDFDRFQSFWSKDIEPRFYVFLERLFQGQDSKEKQDGLRTLFNSLEAFGEDSERLWKDETRDEDTSLVIVPFPGDHEPVTLRVVSVRNEYPPDHNICCGERLYSLETFRIITAFPNPQGAPGSPQSLQQGTR
jgi:hypothetical protein